MKTKPVLRAVHRVAHVATIPLQIAVRRIPDARKKKAVKLSAGGVIMLIGVVIAKNPFHLMNHIFADVIGYGVHAYGAAPFIKVLCARFDLEDINESHTPVVVPQVNTDNLMRDRAWRNM